MAARGESGRQLERRLERVDRNQNRRAQAAIQAKPFVELSLDRALEEEDLASLLQERRGFQTSLTQITAIREIYRLFTSVGVGEDLAFRVSNGYSLELERELDEQSDGKFWAELPRIKVLQGVLQRGKVFYWDPVEERLANEMSEKGASKGEVLNFMVDNSRYQLELIALQVDSVKKQEAERKKQKKEAAKAGRASKVNGKGTGSLVFNARPQIIDGQPISETDPEVPEPFPLSEWNLFWSPRLWSTDGVIPLPTDSRRAALEAVRDLSRGKISIKPSSVVNAMKHFLVDRTDEQRRNSPRFLAGERLDRKWSYVKRGHDCIAVSIPNEPPNTAVVFAGSLEAAVKAL